MAKTAKSLRLKTKITEVLGNELKGICDVVWRH